ncbi:hypothetical protein [Gelidibacter pelagius]|uniref:Uncharacterized protein n=1 Tax=Gelidibacter pelagius TaxID=2819985 RepID=A0ABS3SWG2_9FLAO|nr:hypothetical protein [Gelidibacter pelagius]MBO3100053.1 hypothetical protein [Gelidibacter pelagius]
MFSEEVLDLIVYYGFESDVEKFVTIRGSRIQTYFKGNADGTHFIFLRCLYLLKHLDSLAVHNGYYGKQSNVAQK